MKYLEIPVFIVVIVLIIISLAYCNRAHAWNLDSVGASTGINNGTLRADGNYQQKKIAPDIWWKIDRKDVTTSIEVSGETFASWLRWTAAFTKRGGYEAIGRFYGYDEDYIASLRAGKDNGGVRSTLIGWGRVRAVELTLDPTWKGKRFDLFARVGVSYYHAKTYWCSSLKPVNNCNDAGYVNSDSIKGKTPFLAFGTEFHINKQHSVFGLAYSTKREQTTSAAIRNNRGWRAGYRFYF